MSWSEALSEITSLVARNIANTTGSDEFCERGDALCVLGKYDEAINYYEESIALNPRNANAWAKHGVALMDKGQIIMELAQRYKPDKLPDKADWLEFTSLYARGIDSLNEAGKRDSRYKPIADKARASYEPMINGIRKHFLG